MRFEPLQTQRLLIRPARADDVTALHTRRNQPEVAQYQNWALPFSMDRASAIVEGSAALDGPTIDEWWMGSVVTEAGEVAGDVAVRLEWEGHTALIGYTLNRSHWGMGYATEAAAALVDWLFETAGVARVSAMTHPENIASAMVLERLGFVFEGHTRSSFWAGDEGSDDWLFGLLRDDWQVWRSRPRARPEEVDLVPITPENAFDVLKLATHKTQERFVATMAQSFTDALFPEVWEGAPMVPWPRAVKADGEMVGFVMLALVTDAHPEPYLWRLLIDRTHQGRGIGSLALDEVVEACRGMSSQTLTTSWETGRGTPEPFYLSYGFEKTGEIVDGEIEGRLRFS